MDGARVFVDGAWREDKLGAVAPLTMAAGREDRTVQLRPDAQTYVASLEEVDPFYQRVKAAVCSVCRPLASPVDLFLLGDGAPWIWNRADQLQPLALRVHQISDFFHACEHLMAAADALIASPERRREWFSAARHGLRTHGGADAIERLHALPPRGARQRRVRDTTIQYFVDRADRMRYPEYEAHGSPIGSGVIESACGHVAGKRVKNPGMRWSYGGVQAVLTLRALYRSGPEGWAAFWKSKPQLKKPDLRDVTWHKYAKVA